MKEIMKLMFKKMFKNMVDLDLRGTKITRLPNISAVCDTVDLRGKKISQLPDSLCQRAESIPSCK